ncbi:hypothetical protein DMC30DRAFT_400040 [Rhodotorula diobovata]|uniref:Uncharacterized protein n=1 Tax=Rhodotorula diobovata TaxID=5288 RepID=A0A5C5FRR5_9BASI|nr:hypothetical protein DMC30DRAFT_400040 [Rhodotorula diobovata]
MSKQLVQLSLPGPGGAASVHATFASPSDSLEGLVTTLLAEDGAQIKRTVCGRGHAQADDLGLWRVQRTLNSSPNSERTDEELADLEGDRLLSPELTVEEALALTGSAPPPPPPGPASPHASSNDNSTQFSDFLLSSHLHAPSLRLVFTPNLVEFTFEHIPGLPEGFRFRLFLGAETTAGETVEALMEELGVAKFAIQGHKSARIEYCVQTSDGSRSASLPSALFFRSL